MKSTMRCGLRTTGLWLAGIIGGLVTTNLLDTSGLEIASAAHAEGGTVSADEWSPTKPYPVHHAYYPGTEELRPDEIRVIACGSGIPMPRLKQASPCFLIELGNGDKFIFDIGVGAMERITSLGIPLDFIDKIFITHLHMDHMGDLPAFYILGPQNNRSVGLRVWGPGGGGSPEKWGMTAAMENMEDTWVWMTDTLAGTIDGRSFQLDVTEFDWSKVNNVIYDENGVVIRSVPAIHLEQSASLILEWNGMKIAYSGDTIPNKWWVEHTKGVDLSIHEAFFPPELSIEKWGFSAQEALNAVTTVHSTAAFFGKVMAMTEPKHAVAFHAQNDFDTLPALLEGIRSQYAGPVDVAQDYMVWNVTKDGVRTRMAVVNPESYPTPPLQEKKVATGDDAYKTPDWVLDGFPDEVNEIAEGIYADFNEKNGTAFEFQLKK